MYHNPLLIGDIIAEASAILVCETSVSSQPNCLHISWKKSEWRGMVFMGVVCDFLDLSGLGEVICRLEPQGVWNARCRRGALSDMGRQNSP